MNGNQQAMFELLKEIQLKWKHFNVTTVIIIMVEKIGDYYDEISNEEELIVYQHFIDWKLSCKEVN